MAPTLIIVIGVAYAYVAFDLIRTGNLGLGLAFAGYSFANYGLWLAAKNG